MDGIRASGCVQGPARACQPFTPVLPLCHPRVPVSVRRLCLDQMGSHSLAVEVSRVAGTS